jgi:hypothetical protein
MILGHIPCTVRREPFFYLYTAVTRDEGNAEDGRFQAASNVEILTDVFAVNIEGKNFYKFDDDVKGG